jgi:hypothetical protein
MTPYRVVLAVGVLAAMLTLAPVLYLVPALRNAFWSTATRVHYTVVVVAAVVFVWFLECWKLLGWRYHPQ